MNCMAFLEGKILHIFIDILVLQRLLYFQMVSNLINCIELFKRSSTDVYLGIDRHKRLVHNEPVHTLLANNPITLDRLILQFF